MKSALKATVASAVLLSAAGMVVEPAHAGGAKDFGYSAPRAAAGPCYFRGDVGYAGYTDPDVTWPVRNQEFDYADANGDGFADGDTNQNGVIDADEVTSRYEGDTVSSVSFDNTWFGEVGVGCGSGSRGFRAEAVLGFRGTQKLDGEPLIVQEPLVGTPVPTPPTPITDDPLHVDLQSYTAMVNLYYDLGKFGRFVPYVGVGLGVAYHRLGEVSFTGNPALNNRIEGNNDLAFAWSLMAGTAYQISDRAILDIGYRYSDLGSIESGRADNGGFVNPAVRIDDITSHEIKVGLRYHFGSTPAPIAYAPMK